MSAVSQARRRNSRRFTHLNSEDLARVRDWIERDISFVDHEIFARQNAELLIQKDRPASLDQPLELPQIEPGIAFVSGMVEAPLLTQLEEIYLFTWMNFLRFRAEKTRRLLCLNAPDISLIEQIEAGLAQGIEVRNRIVRSNLRLVVALAKKLAGSMDQMAELISEATIPLIRAVELFDVGLGNRFSTYATWAVRNHMLRCLKRRRQLNERTVAHDDLWLNRLADERGIPGEDAQIQKNKTEAVQRLLKDLPERERFIIGARFGLDGQPRGQSLQDIAAHVGLSKERVRQILIRGLEKLAASAGAYEAIDL